jgi:hypothetical protein
MSDLKNGTDHTCLDRLPHLPRSTGEQSPYQNRGWRLVSRTHRRPRVVKAQHAHLEALKCTRTLLNSFSAGERARHPHRQLVRG